MIIFSFKTMVWASSFEKQLRSVIHQKEIQKSCNLQLKEGLIPQSCYQLKSFDSEFLKIKCLLAVKNTKISDELLLEPMAREQIDKVCLFKIEERFRDLQYKERKSMQ